MTTTTPQLVPIIPRYGSDKRPARLVNGADDAVHACLAQGEPLEWPDLVARACDEMLARCTGSRVTARPGGRQSRPVKRAARSPDGDRRICMAAELLGTLVTRVASCSVVDELCRAAFPGWWDAALDDYAADTGEPGTPDPVLYDHEVPLASIKASEGPWPAGLDVACLEVSNFAHLVGAASSNGLALAHTAPGPVVWPPPEDSQAVRTTRQELRKTLTQTTTSQQEHTEMLFSCLSARDDPDSPDPIQAEIDQVNASLREWDEKVLPVARRLATATYAQAWEWTSSDPQRWDPGVIAYAYAEAYLSVYDLRQVTDICDMTSAACRSYAWWWCHDRTLDLSGLRELAVSW
ncbi:hypothetical protein [Candidatus Poriferisodalis sp.]|uniref:hypothetical protein n=1 Tax=Candidatus Poriferisodalis sp. TaxID=3101277 RepID=UPI003D0F1D66